MVANKDVLRYMPRANIDALTYTGQLFQWAKTISASTGVEQIRAARQRDRSDAPVPPGLPSSRRSPAPLSRGTGRREAVQAWEYMRQLWQYTHPQSLSYAFMQDHAAQPGGAARLGLRRAVEDGARPAPRRPRRIPGPTRPEAQSYMPVINRARHSENAPNPRARGTDQAHGEDQRASADPLADGILPVVGGQLSKQISPGLLAEANAVRKQQKAKDAVKALLPIGIGAENGNFSKIYRDTFTKIVRNGENIPAVRTEGELLDQVFVKTNAPAGRPIRRAGKRGAGSSERVGPTER